MIETYLNKGSLSDSRLALICNGATFLPTTQKNRIQTNPTPIRQSVGLRRFKHLQFSMLLQKSILMADFYLERWHRQENWIVCTCFVSFNKHCNEQKFIKDRSPETEYQTSNSFRRTEFKCVVLICV
jgi:hypothetical protein